MLNHRDDISTEKLHHAYSIAADVVARHGDAYLPVFQRLHAEIEALKARQDIKQQALKVALRPETSF